MNFLCHILTAKGSRWPVYLYLLTARRLGGWAMFDEATDRLMNATPQTILVEQELARRVRWSFSKLVPDVFSKSC